MAISSYSLAVLLISYLWFYWLRIFNLLNLSGCKQLEIIIIKVFGRIIDFQIFVPIYFYFVFFTFLLNLWVWFLVELFYWFNSTVLNFSPHHQPASLYENLPYNWRKNVKKNFDIDLAKKKSVSARY